MNKTIVDKNIELSVKKRKFIIEITILNSSTTTTTDNLMKKRGKGPNILQTTEIKHNAHNGSQLRVYY